MLVGSGIPGGASNTTRAPGRCSTKSPRSSLENLKTASSPEGYSDNGSLAISLDMNCCACSGVVNTRATETPRSFSTSTGQVCPNASYAQFSINPQYIPYSYPLAATLPTLKSRGLPERIPRPRRLLPANCGVVFNSAKLAELGCL